jgi:hypothetical protein
MVRSAGSADLGQDGVAGRGQEGGEVTDPTSSERTFPHLVGPPHVITATGQNGITPFIWDPTDDSDVGVWESVNPSSGTADLHGNVTADFPDSGRWKQT